MLACTLVLHACVAGAPTPFGKSARSIRFEPTSKYLFIPTGTINTAVAPSIYICTDTSNVAGCIVDTAGGLLTEPFDVAFQGSNIYSE